MSGSHITVPRDDNNPPLGNNAHLLLKDSLINLRVAPTNQFLQFSADLDQLNVQLEDLYSNELCNGDGDDDKELEKEDDMEDAIVDYQGHTNRGYGSTLPKTYFEDNHIMDGSMITVPREEGPMRNSI